MPKRSRSRPPSETEPPKRSRSAEDANTSDKSPRVLYLPHRRIRPRLLLLRPLWLRRRKFPSFLPDYKPSKVKVDKDSDSAKKLAKIVAPTKKEQEAPPGSHIIKAEVEKEEKNKRRRKWKDLPLMMVMKKQKRQKKREALHVENKFEKPLPLHWIPAKGFTMAEYQICEAYMTWKPYEFEFPIPEEYREFKVYMDQIRRSKGYRVTISKPFGFEWNWPNFIPYDTTNWEKEFTLNLYMTEMILLLIETIGEQFKNFRPAGLQLTHAVSCPNSWVYLLSHVFEPQTIAHERKGEVKVNVVQSMFHVKQGPRVAHPCAWLHFSLIQWKLRNGSRLVYSSASTKTAEEYLKKCNSDLHGLHRNISKEDTKQTIELKKKQDPEAKKKLDQERATMKINGKARNIPPFNLDATTPETAYPLDMIIIKGEWGYLTDICSLSKSGAELNPDSYPTFVCNRVHKLDSIEDDSEKRQLGAIFAYIVHLLKFKDKHSMDGVESEMDGVELAKKFRIPMILHHRFSSLFSPTESKRLPGDKRDLLTNYILVLSLYADAFRSDFSDIAKDLRMNAMDLRPYLENLGCKLVKEKHATLATLPVPLKFPEVRIKRKRS